MGVTGSQLDRVIGGSFADALAFHGDLGLTSGAWAVRIKSILQKCGPQPSDPAAAVFAERLHSRDLYLATAARSGTTRPGGASRRCIRNTSAS